MTCIVPFLGGLLCLVATESTLRGKCIFLLSWLKSVRGFTLQGSRSRLSGLSSLLSRAFILRTPGLCWGSGPGLPHSIGFGVHGAATSWSVCRLCLSGFSACRWKKALDCRWLFSLAAPDFVVVATSASGTHWDGGMAAAVGLVICRLEQAVWISYVMSCGYFDIGPVSACAADCL